MKIREELIKLGAKPSQLDQGLFTWSIINKPVGIMVCFVCYVLWGGNKNFIYIINKLKQTFHIGAEQGQAFNYIGIHLKLNDDFSTTINQIDYINSIHEIKVSDILERSKNDKLIQKEIISLRGALGKINWVAGMSRPEISYHVCHISSRVKNATISDIFTINKVIKFIKSTPSHITIPVMNLEFLQLLLYSDASFNNLSDVGSQGGYIVFLCDKFSNSAPIAWNSIRLKRVTRPTLAAETLALTDGCDTVFFIANLMTDILQIQTISVTATRWYDQK